MSGYHGRASVPKRDYYSNLFSAERERGMAFEKEYAKGWRSYSVTYYLLCAVYLVGVVVAWVGFTSLVNFPVFWGGCCICCLVAGLLVGARRWNARVLGLVLGLLILTGSFFLYGFSLRSRSFSIGLPGLPAFGLLGLCFCVVLLGGFGSVFFWEAVRFLRCNRRVVGLVSDIFPMGDVEDGETSEGFYPVVEYVVDDLVWHTSLPRVKSEDEVQLGSSVQVWCASDNPNIAFTRGIVKRSEEG